MTGQPDRLGEVGMDDYDVIVVGCRVAGASTALLLARRGVRVLAVDRARFPSDTLSTHQLQVPGAACLARWGLLDRLAGTNLPPVTELTFDAGSSVVRGSVPRVDQVQAMYSPRRTVLDAMLVDAAREAGAEILEGFDVEELISDDGAVAGVSGRARGARRTGSSASTFRARLVVGADGKHSRVAAAVAAAVTRSTQRAAAAFYAYWEGLDLPHGRMVTRPGLVVGAFPTHDGLSITYVGLPAGDADGLRHDPATGIRQALDRTGELGERVRAARLAGPVRGTTDLPNVVRQASGPGWVLAGDAGLVMDPITGQGMHHAMLDAEAIADAVATGLSGSRPLAEALSAYGRQRDAARRGMFDLTTDLASFTPRPGSDQLFAAIAADPAHSNTFFAVMGGATPPRELFSARGLRRVLGWRGLFRLIRAGRPGQGSGSDSPDQPVQRSGRTSRRSASGRSSAPPSGSTPS
jgi:flavin-dependent dehydrogenase